jgi:hypothetical protein
VAEQPIRETTLPDGVTPEEWKAALAMVQEMRRQRERTTSYNRGLEAAAQQAEAWAAQCCGGSGEGGEGYRNLAIAIRRMASSPETTDDADRALCAIGLVLGPPVLALLALLLLAY